MKALICPNEPVSTGIRVAQVAEVPFEVAPPLMWVDCDDTIVADVYFYQDGVFKLTPPPPAPEVVVQPQPQVQGAQTL